MEKWELAYDDYTDGMKYKDIAEKHGVSVNTVKSWKSRKWNALDKVAHKKVATKEKRLHTKKEVQQPKLKETERAIEEVQENDSLSEKQKLFCIYYSQYNNATKAYQEAYEVDYSTAHSIGYRMLARDGIRAEIKRIKAARAADWLINEADIINEWIKQAFANISDFVTFRVVEEPVRDMFGGKVKDEDTGEVLMRRKNVLEFNPSDQVDGTVIQEAKQGKDGASIKLYDKQTALKELHKLIGSENVLKLERLEADTERAKVELRAIKEEIEGVADDSSADDGFLEAIDKSMSAVWGDTDAD